jgi:hypothetical protein
MKGGEIYMMLVEEKGTEFLGGRGRNEAKFLDFHDK